MKEKLLNGFKCTNIAASGRAKVFTAVINHADDDENLEDKLDDAVVDQNSNEEDATWNYDRKELETVVKFNHVENCEEKNVVNFEQIRFAPETSSKYAKYKGVKGDKDTDEWGQVVEGLDRTCDEEIIDSVLMLGSVSDETKIGKRRLSHSDETGGNVNSQLASLEKVLQMGELPGILKMIFK